MMNVNDLNKNAEAGLTLYAADAINDVGDIVALGVIPGGDATCKLTRLGGPLTGRRGPACSSATRTHNAERKPHNGRRVSCERECDANPCGMCDRSTGGKAKV